MFIPNRNSISLKSELDSIKSNNKEKKFDEKILYIKNCLIFIEKNIHSKNLVFGTSQDYSFNTVNLPEIYRLGLYTSFYQTKLNYTPPEVLFNNKYNGIKSDMWILGCFIYNILLEKDLFEKETDSKELLTKYQNILFIKKQINNFSLCDILLNENIKMFGKFLLTSTLQINPNKRKTTRQLLEHFENVSLISPVKNNKDIVLIKINTSLNQIIDLNKIIENEFKIKIALTEEDKNFLYVILNDFLKINEKNFLKTVLDNEELFFVKFILITKVTVIYILINKGILHPNNDKIFIKEFLEFSNIVDEDELIMNMSNKIFIYISENY